jgi:hypothetical protein
MERKRDKERFADMVEKYCEAQLV